MAQSRIDARESTFDLKQTVTDNRLLGLWRMLTGYHTIFAASMISIGLAAVFHTGFFYLLRYYTDNVLGEADMVGQLPWIALDFVLLALGQGTFTFLSGRWAAAAEGARCVCAITCTTISSASLSPAFAPAPASSFAPARFKAGGEP